MILKRGDVVTLADGCDRLDACYPAKNRPCPTPYTGFIINYETDAFPPDIIDYEISCLAGCNHKKWVYSCHIKDHDAYGDFLAKIEDRMT